MSTRPHGRRRWAWAVALGALLACQGQVAAKTKLTVAIPWGTTNEWNGVFPALTQAFQQKHPDVEIEFLTGWGNDKIIAAAAGHALPDIIFGWGRTKEFQDLVYLPLDSFMQQKGIRLSDYLPGAARQMNIGGKTWSLQVFIDPNFPLLYNKTLFANAGLDPNRPPRTISEFDAMFPKLTRRNAEGRITQIAFSVWHDLGGGFSALTWPAAFGGELWTGNEREGRFGLTSPRFVAAYEWLREYYDNYHRDAAGILGSPGPGPAIGRLVNGQEAMTLWLPFTLRLLRQQASVYEWGIAPPFYDPEHGTVPIWFGGWAAGVSRQSANPELAFDFVAFMSYSPEGQTIWARVGDQFPATKRSPGFAELVKKNPEFEPFMQAIQISTLAPATYYLNVDWGPLTEAYNRIFGQGVSPKNALEDAQRKLEAQARAIGITVR